MDTTDIDPGIVDHTVLGPETTSADVGAVMDQAAEYGLNACIPPCYVAEIADRYPSVQCISVVGFPHGTQTPQSKCLEAKELADAGADELDVVITVGQLLDGDPEYVTAELRAIVEAVPVPVKAIIEAPLLDQDEVEQAAQCAANAGCSHVKTATGYADGGATVEDVEIMAEYLPVKASGGIRTPTFANELIAAGADRIGTSSGPAVIGE